MPDLTFGLP